MTEKLPVSYHCRAGTESELRKFSQLFPACRYAILTTLSVSIAKEEQKKKKFNKLYTKFVENRFEEWIFRS